MAVGYYNSFIYFVNKFKETKGNVRVRLKIMDNCLTLNKRPISLFMVVIMMNNREIMKLRMGFGNIK